MSLKINYLDNNIFSVEINYFSDEVYFILKKRKIPAKNIFQEV
jgi:hypothetical protein